MKNKHAKNKGYITVEASLVVSIFLFFLLGMAQLYMILMAETHIHQALASSAEQVALYAYLNESVVNSITATGYCQSYIGDDFYVEKVVTGGKKGVLVKLEKDRKNEKVLQLTAVYQVGLQFPLLGTYSTVLSDQIKQKTFVGFSKEEFNEEDTYVYVTPNREAYHLRRDCTHLVLDVTNMDYIPVGSYTPCHYCGRGAIKSSIYVAKNGEVYHCNRDCVGLKRTVRRVKKSAVKGVHACERCGA